MCVCQNDQVSGTVTIGNANGWDTFNLSWDFTNQPYSYSTKSDPLNLKMWLSLMTAQDNNEANIT